MNCAECRDNLVGCAEGLLDPKEAFECQAHLESCAECRFQYAAIETLQNRLIDHGQAAAGVTVVDSVMRRVHERENEPQRKNILNIFLKHRWGFGLGMAASMAAIVLMVVMGTSKMQVAAAQVMSRGAQAVAHLSSIHLRGHLRTAPADNFSAIMADQEFVTVELWEQFEPTPKWRVDKPGRTAIMDGESTLLFIKPDYAYKLPQPSSSAFDTQWLHELANLNRTLSRELSAIKAHGWPVALSQERGADGKSKSVITVEAKSGLLTGDYLKNKFFGTADTRRVYVFDDEAERLEAVKIYVHAESGEKLVFELDQIDYNQPMEPGVFQLQLPANVVWEKEMEILPDNDKYAAMTPEVAARTFFEACARKDWNEVSKFCTIRARLKEHLGALEVLNIGQSFTSAVSLVSGAHFVPYEIKLKDGQIRKHNLALKRDTHTQRWFIDGGI
jgi:hypothetical protein